MSDALTLDDVAESDEVRRRHDRLIAWAMSDTGRAIIEMDRHLVARQGLKAFTRLAWHTIEGESTYRSNWHIDAIFEYLERVSRGELRRLAISMPPRHMKSISCAIMWPAWDWIDHPWRRSMFASYAHNLSIRDSVRCRRVIQSDWYQLRWGDRFKLTTDQNTKIRFENNFGGYRLSTSVDGQLTGEGGDFIVCFPADQDVMTEVGPLPIGEIVNKRRPLRVWSYDPETGGVALKPVTGWHKNPGRQIVRVTLGDGTSFRCTPDHRIWTLRGWVRADSLLSSDVLPSPAVPDVRDAFLVDSKLASQRPIAIGAVEDKANIPLGQPASGALFSPGSIGGFADSVRDGVPSFAPSDLLNGLSSNAVSSGEVLGEFVASGDGYSLVSCEDGAWAFFQDRECPVALGVGDVFAAGPISQVGEARIAAISIKMPHLMTFGAWANERTHNGAMDKNDDAFAVPSGVEPRIPLMGWSFDDSSGNPHRFSASLNDPWITADAPPIRHPIAREVGDRSPVLIELVGHAESTFCLSVADYHTFILWSNGYVIVSNCDDAHNVREAESEPVREGTIQWWDEAMSSRLNDPMTGAYVLVQQRVHERDLMGHVLSKSSSIPWEILCLPAEFEPDHPQRWFRDPRKEAGELLWPERVPRAELEDLKSRLGPYATAAQLQQRPAPREGGIFKRAWFKTIKVAPIDTRWVRGWDLAASEAKLVKSDPDYTASALVGWSNAMQSWVIGHVERFREEPHLVEQAMLNRAESDGVHIPIDLPQDPGQAGKAQVKNLMIKLSKFSVFSEAVTGDKMTRAIGWAAKAGAGMVSLVEADWNKEFLDEVTSFPTAAHDDMVDAVSGAFRRLTGNSFGIAEYYMQQLRDMGVNPTDLQTPYERLEEERMKAAEAQPMPTAGVRDVVSSDPVDMWMRSDPNSRR